MSRLLKAVNNKSSPKKSRGLSVACAPTEWAKKNQTARVSRQRGVGFSKKTIFKTVSPYRISHFIHEGYFPPVPPAQMRWALARPHVPMGNLRCSPGVAGDDGTRATTERGNHARGTDRQKKILHRPFVFRDAETRVGTPVGRTFARFPPRTGNDRRHLSSSSRINANHTHLAEATG